MTVLLATAFFGEALGAVQLAGGAALFGGVLVLSAPPRPRRAARANRSRVNEREMAACARCQVR